MSTKLSNRDVDEFWPVAQRMLAEGRSPQEIERTFAAHMARRKKASSCGKPGAMKSIDGIMPDVIRSLEESMRKSETIPPERALFDRLKTEGIRFSFQREIGRYTVPFLVEGFLVIDLMRPGEKAHDEARTAYLDDLGYKIYSIEVDTIRDGLDRIISIIRRGVLKYRGGLDEMRAQAQRRRAG